MHWNKTKNDKVIQTIKKKLSGNPFHISYHKKYGEMLPILRVTQTGESRTNFGIRVFPKKSVCSQNNHLMNISAFSGFSS